MNTNEKKVWVRYCVVGLVIIYLIISMSLVLSKRIQPELNSSLIESRDIPTFRSLGILQPSARNLDEDRPAGIPFPFPTMLEGQANDFVSDWDEQDIKQIKPTEKPDRWSIGWKGMINWNWSLLLPGCHNRMTTSVTRTGRSSPVFTMQKHNINYR